MKLEMKVHSIAVDEVPFTAKVDGKDRTVKGDVLTVELVDDRHALTLRFDDVEEAQKFFDKRKIVTLTLSGAK